MARIEISHDGHTQEYSIDSGSIIIGRGNSCNIKVPSVKASRKHCKIFKGTGGFFLEDLSSANGTILNGARIGHKLLKHNDEIIVGGVKLRFIDKRDDPLVGKRLGRYQILEKIGVGSEGVIYRGRQVALNKEVAIKVLNNEFIHKKGGLAALEREVDIALLLRHDNIVHTMEFSQDKGSCFYCMQLVEGENLLDKTIRQGRVKVDDVIDYALNLTSALDYMHCFGILHGDIKPHNMIIGNDNNLVVIDLGLATRLPNLTVESDESEVDTEISGDDEKKIFATPQYVAPELIKRQSPLPQSDIYSLSVTLYQLLTGVLPYQDERIEELLKQHLSPEVKNPCELNPNIPQKFGELIVRGMSVDPLQRPANAQEFELELLSIPRQKKNRKKRNTSEPDVGSNKYLLVKVLCVLLVVIALGIFGVREYEKYTHAQAVKLEEDYQRGVALYEQEDYQRAKNVLSEVLSQNPPAAIADPARKIMQVLELSKEALELQRLQEKLRKGLLTKEQVVERLRSELRSGELTEEARAEYAVYIDGLGGDSDIRYEWQKKVDELLEGDDLLAAYQLILHSGITPESDLEALEFTAYEQRVLRRLNSYIKVEYEAASKLLAQSQLQKAIIILQSIADTYPVELGWRGRIISYFAQLNQRLGQKILQSFTASLAAIKTLDATTLHEEVFQLQSAMSKQAFADDIASIERLPEFMAAFEGALIARAQRSVGDELIEVNVAGKSEFLKLGYEDGRLLALAEDSKVEIELTDIALSSLERLLAIFEIGNKEAVGAGLYFLARGDLELSRVYLQAAREGESSLGAVVENYLEFAQKRVEILPAVAGLQDQVVLSAAVALGGSRIQWDLVKSKELLFATSAQQELGFKIAGQEVVAFINNMQSGIQELGRAPLVGGDGNTTLEIVGYWDKILLLQNGVVIGDFKSAAIGKLSLAPVGLQQGVLKIMQSINLGTAPVERKPVAHEKSLG